MEKDFFSVNPNIKVRESQNMLQISKNRVDVNLSAS